MGKTYNFDYIIIGSGPAGITAATALSNANKRVALIESQTLGGNNLNTRDIPYGISMKFAHAFSNLLTFPEISGQNLHYNFPSIASNSQRIVSDLVAETEKNLIKNKVTILHGYAYLIDQNTIAVNNKNYTAKNFILATGCKLDPGDITGLDRVNYLTPNTALNIRRLPRFVFVVGGGSTGCEIAEYYAELGTKVILMEKNSSLLPNEDPEVGLAIQNYLSNELGVLVITSAKVVAITGEGPVKCVIFNNGKREKAVRVDCVILATGTTPITDYGLENAGVKYTKTGIKVNQFFQTSAKNIYAIGDSINYESSTERAEYEALVLTSNLLKRSKTPIELSGFIRATHTMPEVATVGLNESALLKAKRKYKKSIIYLNTLPAAKINHFEYGFVKILATRSNQLLGATIVAPNAVLMAEELSLAIRNNLTALEVASTPHVSNSFNYAIKLAAKSLLTAKITSR